MKLKFKHQAYQADDAHLSCCYSTTRVRSAKRRNKTAAGSQSGISAEYQEALRMHRGGK